MAQKEGKMSPSVERSEIAIEDAAKSLWRKYRKTPEYRSGRRYSISSLHPLVRAAEEQGLNRIILDFAKELEQPIEIRTRLAKRSETDWINDWCHMHDKLLGQVYRQSGELRPRGHDVRFGTPGDEEIHRIPHGGAEVYNELYGLARDLMGSVPYVAANNLDETCRFLARFHYSFIRIHPFPDGNGRIARVVTDQLSVALGYIPIIAGFPRHNAEKKQIYHNAIQECAHDSSYTALTEWIKFQLQQKLSEII